MVPEILEVEMYRRLAVAVIGRQVSAVRDDDPIVVHPAGSFGDLVGETVERVERHGKVVSLHFSRTAACMDLHFGMTGRLIVDGRAGLDSLVYGAADNERWIRFALAFTQGDLLISDPRRFSKVRWRRPDEHLDLGPDVMSVDAAEFVRRLEESGRRAVKAVLLDQKVLAGLGNMLVDEILLRAGVDPRARVETLSSASLVQLHRIMGEVLVELLARGGSHAGLLAYTLRKPGAPCPLDGTPLAKMTVAGRTTFACPDHQR